MNRNSKLFTRLSPLALSLAAWIIVPMAHAAITQGPPIVLGDNTDAPTAPQGALSFTVDDGVGETSIGDAGQFVWFNRFTPAPADFPFQINDVQVVLGATGVTVGDAIQVLVYSDTDGDGDPGTGAVLLGSFDSTVQFNDGVTFNVYTLPAPVRVDGPGDVLIGVVNRASFEGAGDFPATIDTTATAGRSWVGSYLAGDAPAQPPFPADEQWGTIDSFGFPGNWMVRATGTRIAVLPPAAQVPALGTLGLILLGAFLVVATLLVNHRRKTQQ